MKLIGSFPNRHQGRCAPIHVGGLRSTTGCSECETGAKVFQRKIESIMPFSSSYPSGLAFLEENLENILAEALPDGLNIVFQ